MAERNDIIATDLNRGKACNQFDYGYLCNSSLSAPEVSPNIARTVRIHCLRLTGQIKHQAPRSLAGARLV